MTTDATTDAATDVRAELAQRTMYDLLGGEIGLRAMVHAFYDRMDADAEYAPIRRMHQADLGPMRAVLFEYLSGWLGGPPLFVDRKGSPCIAGAHAPYAIGSEARDLWVACMDAAMADAGVAERYRELLTPAFQRMAHMLQNVD